MKRKYTPPYDISDEMLELVSEIMENLGKLNNINNLEKLPRLRKVSRIKSIHSSLAIENNTLTIEQVTALLDGKRIVGPKDDILAVENANLAYRQLGEFNPFNVDELFRIHEIMMKDLVLESGVVRSGQVGVYNEKGEIVHMAPSNEIVMDLLESLFYWINNSSTNMLIKSCVFNYEFEFIHPFRDGNGRMGRLWQTALLSSWKPIFSWVPIESIIKDNQEEYYKAILSSTNEGNSNAFILFMLGIINDSIKSLAINANNHINHFSIQIQKLLEVIDSYPQSASELMNKLNLKSRISFRNNYLNPALEMGLIQMTIPDKPTSRNQKYFKV